MGTDRRGFMQNMLAGLTLLGGQQLVSGAVAASEVAGPGDPQPGTGGGGGGGGSSIFDPPQPAPVSAFQLSAFQLETDLTGLNTAVIDVRQGRRHLHFIQEVLVDLTSTFQNSDGDCMARVGLSLICPNNDSFYSNQSQVQQHQPPVTMTRLRFRDGDPAQPELYDGVSGDKLPLQVLSVDMDGEAMLNSVFCEAVIPVKILPSPLHDGRLTLQRCVECAGKYGVVTNGPSSDPASGMTRHKGYCSGCDELRNHQILSLHDGSLSLRKLYLTANGLTTLQVCDELREQSRTSRPPDEPTKWASWASQRSRDQWLWGYPDFVTYPTFSYDGFAQQRPLVQA
jgi:hypothetical protein